MNEQNAIDILFTGSMVAGFIALFVAGHWQEIRMIGKEEKEVRRGASNYGRLQARLSDSSKVIRKGHE